MSGPDFYPLDADIAARRDLPASAKVLRAVLRFRIGRNGHAWSGTRRLAREAGMDRTTVLDAISRLESVGLLVVERRGNGRVSHYRMPTATGGEPPPVGEPDRSLSPTTGGGKSPPQAVGESHQKRTEKNQQNNKRAAAPPDPRVKTFIDWFTETYQQAKGQSYLVNGGKDGATVKRLLHALDDSGIDALSELQQASRKMLADSWGKDRASIGLLASQINTWRGQQDPAAPAHKTGTFTPAESATDYSGLARKF